MKALITLICVGLTMAILFGRFPSGTKSAALPRVAPVASCYTITDLGTLGGTSSQAYGVNDNGEVVGVSYLAGNSVQHAFLYKNGTMQDLGTLGGTYSIAYGINSSGVIAGESITAVPGRHGFKYQNGTMQDIGTLITNGSSSARSINDSGVIAGIASASDGRNHAFLYSNGSMQDLGLITYARAAGANGVNENGQVTGYMDFFFPGSIVTTHAFFYNAGMQEIGNLMGQQQYYSEGMALNDSGHVVGWSEVLISSSNIPRHAFLYQNGTMEDIGTLGQQNSIAYGINNDGDVVGTAYSTNFNHAFIYSNGVMQDLNDFLPPNSNWELVEARAISNTGHIVGSGVRSGVGYLPAFLLSPCAPNTIPGTDVKVPSTAGDASVEFGQVTTAGTTTFTPIDPNTAGTPPTGYSFCPTCPAYDITTTAIYLPPVTVCLAVPVSVDDATFSTMQLWHYVNGVPVNITTVHNASPREICGTVSSLSPFALASPFATPTPTPTSTPTPSPSPTPSPAAPSNLSAEATSANQIDLSWTDNSNNEEGFQVERCAEKGKCRTFVEITQVGTGIKTFSDTQLAPGSVYSYRVRAFNSGGNSGYSNTVKARTPRR